uniref:Uncharacterized protein n=1 Tax=Photinus pyralis TaxID=7054 RepID=A0A1Y1MQQ0_PHOPY
MKLLLLCFLFIAVHGKKLPPEITNAWMRIVTPIYDDCVKITNVLPEIPKTMFEQDELPKDKSFACYMKCVYEKLSFLKSNNEFDKEEMVKEIYMLTPAMAQLCVDESAMEPDMCKKINIIVGCIVREVV